MFDHLDYPNGAYENSSTRIRIGSNVMFSGFPDSVLLPLFISSSHPRDEKFIPAAVAGGRWQVAGGRWQVAGGRTINSNSIIICRKNPES